MSTAHNDTLRELATTLALSLAAGTNDREAVLRMMEQLGYPVGKQTGERTERAAAKAAGNIGIYSPEVIEGEVHYIRSRASRAKWSHYADIESIPPKDARKRVVLLGESVARGFFLDPEYTPATLLESVLNSNDAGDKFEVVDLAETNLSMEGVKQRFIECQALHPDLVIIFAGNNWRTDIEVNVMNSPASLGKLMNAMKQQQGFAGFKTIIEEVMGSLTHSFLSGLQAGAVANNTKVIFAIPEFNLLDYRSTAGEQAITKLPGNGVSRWMDAMNKAQTALATGNMEVAEKQAAAMIVIDPTHPLGYEILADSCLANENFEQARVNLEAAKDCALFFRTSSKPRIYNIIRETMLAGAAEYGIKVVDMQQVFSQHMNGKLPDRTLFFDYCHLTAEGLRLAADAIAATALDVAGSAGASLKMNASSIPADPHVNARAHLLAAIHNGHWGQSYEIIYYHCARALQLSPAMAQSMIDYCDMVSRKTTNVLCHSFDALIAAFPSDRHLNAFRNPEGIKGMERTLVRAMKTALKESGAALPRSMEQEAISTSVNLLEHYYHVTSYDRYPGTRTAFLQSRGPVATFSLPGRAGTPVTLHMTLRAPALAPGTGKALICINDAEVAEVELTEKWSDHDILLTGNGILDGINTLTIRWPVPTEVNMNSGALAAPLSFSGAYALLDSVYCVLGEIIRLQVITGEAYR